MRELDGWERDKVDVQPSLRIVAGLPGARPWWTIQTMEPVS